MSELEADYLVIGSGAMGMAFSDTLLSETGATVAIVDRHHQPGGHWNDAYPFVRLHQPSAFYGVNSKRLGSDTIDQTGWNKGLFELASNSEVCAYFDQVMNQEMLPTGRVSYFPMCDYRGDGEFVSLASGEKRKVNADKVVDATYMNVTVPAIRAPGYQVDKGVHCEPLNALARIQGQFERFVIVGAGKTGMDACLFLLKSGVDPSHITWIMPRDSWLLDRANIQPLPESIGFFFQQQTEAIAGATSIDDLFERVNACGALLRFDEEVTPTMYRCATVTKAELEQLKRIENIVRQGRVKRISPTEVVLDEGTIATNAQTLHVDCSADGLEKRPVEPVFAGNKITLQSVRTCQQVFSAAFIAHVEARYDDETEKNELCTPVPHPDTALDFIHTSLANAMNGARWAADADLSRWLAESRLDAFSGVGDADKPSDPEVGAKLAELTKQSIETLRRLAAQAS